MSEFRFFCDKCGKFISATKVGNYRHHRGHAKEYPGSPWNRVCANTGQPINPWAVKQGPGGLQ